MALLLEVTKNYMNKWDDAYMDTAERFASLSTAKRLKVGSLVVKDNRIISIGYNGMPSGWTNECEYVVEDELSTGQKHVYVGPEEKKVSFLRTKPEVIHAEANAIAKLAGSNESGKDATMYITHAPCVECAKLIYTSGIHNVYYKNEYRNEDGIKFLHNCGLKVIKYD